MTEGADVAAIVLAGGRGSRLGGMSKADLVVGGRRLLDGVLDALRECAPCVVVGPLDTTVSAGVLLTREDPPFSGPAAAVAAGWSVLASFDPQPGWVVLLSCDLPGAADVVGPLIAAASGARGDVDAISAERGAPDGGHREWLVSIVRTRAL
ncbi:MAG: NTP transferase domain-containing protein, partial [Actinobacteria bacterium]|nr:NTP transferase domain-containing protein [Actinomycetota bacterium]